jgi:phage shock protein E
MERVEGYVRTFQKFAIILAVMLVAWAGFLVSLSYGYGDITVDDAVILIDSRPRLIIVDVRTPAEFKVEHLDGAINLCIPCDPDAAIQVLDPGDEILLYCRSGARSAESLRILTAYGYRKVFNMRGGIVEWKEKGYPVVP